METLRFERAAGRAVLRRAYVGVVASGNLEVLLEPADGNAARVVVRTSVDGYGDRWEAVIDRFFARHGVAVAIEINDFGATPAVVALRLEQALEAATA